MLRRQKYRQWVRQTARMRSPRALLIFAALLMIVGLLLWYVLPSDEVSFYGVATAEDAALPWLLFLTTNRVIGVVLFWTGSLLTAGVLGHRLASRQTTAP